MGKRKFSYKVILSKGLSLFLKAKRYTIHKMTANSKKHKILKALTDHWLDGENNTVSGFTVTEFGRCLNNMQIHLRTNINIQEVDNICFTLTNQGFIRSFHFDAKTKLHTYLIEDIGRVAVIEKRFKNLIWFRNFDFWKWVLPVIFSLTALAISLYTKVQN
jgi:hypothetical protein